ncbi:MAG: ABC transporter permease [Lachnospiraceae bacterium]|jgi:ABC-type transport system involved in multi-copper enzyme maturation permease subunit|nr:ABC transporter permease [Lachnospiraceae bacterium]
MELGRLEGKKLQSSVWKRAAAGCFAGLLALGLLFLFMARIVAWDGGDFRDLELFVGWDGLLALMTALSFCVFSIFAAALGARVVIGDYGGKTAVTLLSYPVPRKLILRAKCLLFGGVTVLTAFTENVLVMGLMYGTGLVFGVETERFTGLFVQELLASSFLMGLQAAAVGMVSVTVGWRKRSATAALVCALVILCMFANFIAGAYRILLPAMAVLGVLLAAGGMAAYCILASEIEKLEV